MFGQNDNDKTTVKPQDDDAVDNNAADDSASPAYIPTGSGSGGNDSATPRATTPLPAPAASGDLIEIKQSALKMLTPLVGHLNQTPEEKFRTTMMMIQAADDQSLIKDAYAAAQAISDEKTKAQALLDIINEINYFTQQQS